MQEMKEKGMLVKAYASIIVIQLSNVIYPGP